MTDIARYRLAPPDPATVPAMADLWVQSWAVTMPDIDFEARRGWFLRHQETQRAAGAEVRLAFDSANGALAGFVFIAPATGYLDQLAVAPAFFGKGAAECLLAEARRLSPAHVVLDVNQDNPRAIAFYRRQGFKVTAEGTNPMSGRLTFRMEWTPAAPLTPPT